MSALHWGMVLLPLGYVGASALILGGYYRFVRRRIG